MKFIAYLLFMSLPMMVTASEIHVSPKGNDANSGTVDKPFRTIQAAVNKLKAGDICIVHNGIYRENIEITNSGNANQPITIKASKGEHPIISGLDVLDLKWNTTNKKGIYVADYKNEKLEQLFLNGKPLLEARWPNVPKDKNGDWNFFSPDVWSTVDSVGNHYGTVKDHDLAATGWDINGAKAVLNVCHQFFTWTRIVTGYNSGSDSFNYPKDLGKSVKGSDESGAGLKFNDDRYYLVGKKEFLDAPGEWYYDSEAQKLYLYPTDANAPKIGTLEVKTRNFSLVAEENANYLVIDGVTIFGTAFKIGKDIRNRNSHFVFSNNQVLYSSWTDCFDIDLGKSVSPLDQNFPVVNADNAVITNNVFAYGSLNALLINGRFALVDNNLFHDFNLNSSLKNPLLEINKNTAGYVGKGGNAIVRFNTLYNSGGILSQIGQNDNDVYLNDLHDAFRSCWGGNKDVSALYTQSKFCVGTRFHNNWVHDMYAGTPPLEWNGGIGIRGDDLTSGLTVDHNVVWNTGSVGIMVKNPSNPTPEQANKIVNNTIFHHSKYNLVKTAIIVSTDKRLKKETSADTVGNTTSRNEFSWVVNNLAESIYGSWFAEKLGKVAYCSNNAMGKTVESLLENPNYFDFRPIPTASEVVDKGKFLSGFTTSVFGSAPDIGAYERGDSVYWIPGRRQAKATYPIVADGATIEADRDVLMWRPAYNALGHNVYFGTDRYNLKLKGGFLYESNVFKLPKLVAGKQYFWRVDAVMKDMSVIKGDVWSFTTK